MIINLKKKNSDRTDTPVEAGSSEEYAPTVYISGVKGIGKLPKEGMAKIKYKVSSVTTTDRNGKSNESCEIEIHSIEPLNKVKSIEREDDDYFDETMKKANKKEDGND